VIFEPVLDFVLGRTILRMNDTDPTKQIQKPPPRTAPQNPQQFHPHQKHHTTDPADLTVTITPKNDKIKKYGHKI
jgi:hypothetical protein